MICMTLLVRDEEDILPHHIRYHLSRGIDFFIVTDNRSVDRTTGILLDLQKRGRLLYIREDMDDYAQSVWVTRMARLAKEEFNAEWVLHSDADEFWWLPEGQSFPGYFNSFSDEVDGVVVRRVNYVVQKGYDESKPFYEQLVVRESASFNLFGNPLPPKICHRGFSNVEVAQGNHSYSLPDREPSNMAGNDLLIFHFPYRGFTHLENKIRLGGAAYERNLNLPKEAGSTWRFLYDLKAANYWGQSRIVQNEDDDNVISLYRDYLLPVCSPENFARIEGLPEGEKLEGFPLLPPAAGPLKRYGHPESKGKARSISARQGWTA